MNLIARPHPRLESDAPNEIPAWRRADKNFRSGERRQAAELIIEWFAGEEDQYWASLTGDNKRTRSWRQGRSPEIQRLVKTLIPSPLSRCRIYRLIPGYCKTADEMEQVARHVLMGLNDMDKSWRD